MWRGLLFTSNYNRQTKELIVTQKTILSLHAGDLRTAFAVCRNCRLKKSDDTEGHRTLRGFCIEFPQPGDDDQSNISIIATDKLQLVVCKVAIVGRDEGPLPKQLCIDTFNLKVGAIGKTLSTVTASVTNDSIVFTGGSSKKDKTVRCDVWELRKDETELRYPNWRAHVPTDPAVDASGIVKIKNEEWVSAWDDYCESVGQQHLYIGASGISSAPISRTFELPGNVRLEQGDAFAASINISLIMNHLRQLESSSSTIYFRGPNQPIVITTKLDSVRYLLAPIKTA